MRTVLTDIAIRKIKPSMKRREIPDGKIAGLYLVVQPSGAMSFALRYRVRGVTRKLTLGSYSIGLAEARRKAQEAIGAVARGDDPAGEKATARAAAKAEREAMTLAGLIDDWSALHLSERRVSYAREAVRALRHAFEKHLSAPAAALERAAVVRVLDQITKDRKKAIARLTAAYGRACYQWALKRGTLKENPFALLPLAPAVKRERVLTDDELKRVWQATEGPGPFNSIVRMAIVTGQRRDEVTSMTFDELAVIFRPGPSRLTAPRTAPSISFPCRRWRGRSCAPHPASREAISCSPASGGRSMVFRRPRKLSTRPAPSKIGGCTILEERSQLIFKGLAFDLRLQRQYSTTSREAEAALSAFTSGIIGPRKSGRP
jgi:hypothetical protein